MLTSIGVWVGILTVVTMVSLGIGLQTQITDIIKQWGLETVFVAPQMPRQAVGAFSVLIYSGVVTLILALILKYTIGLRLNPEAEANGIDEAEHAESGYDFAVVTGSVLPPRIAVEDARNGLEEERVGDKVEAEQS